MTNPIDKQLYAFYAYNEDKAMQALWNIVTSEFNVTTDQIKSMTKKRDWTEARHTLMFISHIIFKVTLQNTTEACGRTCHSSVINAKRKIKGFYDVGDPLIEKIETIKQKLYNEIKIN